MFSKAKSQALRYLAYRPRSIQEMKIFLQRKGYTDDLSDETINYLLNLGYLNDVEFSKLWIESRIRLKPMGRKRIYHELLQKGINRQIIEESLELLLTKELENDLAFSLAKNKISVYHNQEKLAGFLYRRGFNTEIIYQIISTIYIDNDSK